MVLLSMVSLHAPAVIFLVITKLIFWGLLLMGDTCTQFNIVETLLSTLFYDDTLKTFSWSDIF